MMSLLKSIFILFFIVSSPQVNANKQDNIITTFLASMVYVEGGIFYMGSDSEEAIKREQPIHQVELDNFYISRTEITQVLFEEVMGWNVSYHACDNCPVNNISWMNIQAFIKKLNNLTSKTFRLPSEAQWEFAAKGGNKSKDYLFSGSNNIADVAWYAKNAKRKSHEVAQKKPNELGIFDMTGNLWEFCHDDMNKVYYQHSPKKNPLFLNSSDLTKTTMKVIRGGGYEFDAHESQVFRRDGATSNVRMPDIGFRLVLNQQEIL
ncbi:MAG: formylglycine-generating enzyme family protein [Colwellia sp.]